MQGLKCVWRLSRDTQSFVLAPLCATIPIMNELCRRSCNFSNACLSSDCPLISFVARQDILYSRMTLLLGRTAHFCCTWYGEWMQDILFILNNYINYRVTSNLPEDILQLSCFSLEDINNLISNVCRDWVLCLIVCCNYIVNFYIVPIVWKQKSFLQYL